MQRSQPTKARFTRLCQIGAVLLSVPILMAIGCPLTVTVDCPADGTAGTAATVTVTVSFGQGAATWTTAATNGTVADGAMATPSVTPTAGGTVTVTVTATDEAGDTATDECTFEATAAACTDDAGCDDGLFCNGAETCDLADPDAGVCVAGTAQCTGDNESCDEANDACITACTDDAGCDDGDPCNGAETCDLTDPDAGVCAAGTAPVCDDGDACTVDTCDASDALADADGCVATAMDCPGQTCVGGVCVDTCVSAADCDDSDPCTDEACVDNACSITAKDCDDGLFCTGTETCNATSGDCESSGDPCDALTETCDETNDECDLDVSCVDDTDCDDGVFCNGAETCDLTDPAAGVCAAGTDPCAADETCNETTDFCDPPPGESLRLTPGNDTFTGGSGDDTFDGSRILDFGVLIVTVNNGDVLDGGGGTDTLDAQITATTTVGALNRIEIFNIEPLAGGLTFNFTNADSVTTVNNNNPVGAFTAGNISTKVSNFGMTNSTSSYTVTVDDAVLTGTTDECTLTLSGVTDAGGTPLVTIQPDAPGSGYEKIIIDSIGAIDNAIDGLTDAAGTSLTTIEITGTRALTIDQALDASVTTVNGSNAGGKINVDLTAATANVTFTGGASDDTVDLSGTYTTSDVVDGGGGSNTLVLTGGEAALATSTQTNVSNIATIELDVISAGDIDVTKFGAMNLNLTTGAAAADIFTLPNGATVKVTNVNPAGSNTFTASATGTADVLNLELNGIAWTTNIAAGTFETLNLMSKTGANSVGGTLAVNDSGTPGESIVVTGDQNLTLTGAVTADLLDASALTGNLVMGAPAVNGLTVNGGSGADTLDGSPSGDVLNGNAGIDLLIGEDGADNLDGGAGDDVIRYDTQADGSDAGTNTGQDTILNFSHTAGAGGDSFRFLDFSITAANGFAIVSADLNDVAPMTDDAAGTQLQVVAAGAATLTTNEIIVITGTGSLTLTDLAAVGTAIGAITAGTATAADAENDAIFVVSNGTDTGIYLYVNADAAGAGNTAVDADEIGILGIIIGASITTGTTTADLVFGT